MSRLSRVLPPLLLLGLASSARGFYPTLPEGAWALMAALAWGALVSGHATWRARLSWWHVVLAVPALAALGFMAAHGAILLFILAGAWAFVAYGGLALVAVAALLARTRRPAASLVVGSLAVFAAAAAYLPLCAWMWWPPSDARCDAVAAQPGVERLTPAEWVSGLSYPYEVEVRPSDGRVAASLKMAGNLTLPSWDRADANRLVVFDPGAAHLAVLPMPGLQMPQYLAWLPDGTLAVNRLGFGDHSVDLVDLGAWPELTLRIRAPTELQVHALGAGAPGEVVMATMMREVVALDAHTLEPRRVMAVPAPVLEAGFTITDAVVAPGTSVAYLAMLGPGVVRVDVGRTPPTVRVAPVPFGAGEIDLHAESRSLFLTDFFGDALRRVDTRDLKTTAWRPLGYAPRPVAVDAGSDRVFVGDWFGGAVHAYRRSTLEPLLGPIDVGPYLRSLAWDGERQTLYAGSKCGLVRIGPEALRAAR